MLKLNNKKIMTCKELKENFDFIEILNEIEDFLEFSDFIITGEESKIICMLIKNCVNNIGESYFIKHSKQFNNIDDLIEELEHYLENTTKSSRLEIYKNENKQAIDKIINDISEKQWSINKSKNIVFIIFAIHYLSQANIKSYNYIEYFDDNKTKIPIQENKNIDIKENERTYTAMPLPNDHILIGACYYIYIYDFTIESNYEIITKKYKNKVNSLGKTKIYILTEQNICISTIKLEYNEQIIINTINNMFINVISNISIGNNHCIFRVKEKESEHYKLIRYDLLNDEYFQYNNQKASDITEFCVDAGRGFIGIKNGEISPFTNIDFDELYDVREKISSIYINGYLYMVLTVNGKVYTNYIEAKEWNNIISIYFGKDEAAYGITSDGKIISTNKKSEKEINNKSNSRKAIYISAYSNNYIIKYSDGTILINTDSNITAQADLYAAHKNGIISALGNTIYIGNQRIDIKEKILEIEASEKYIIARTKQSKIKIYNIETMELSQIY